MAYMLACLSCGMRVPKIRPSLRKKLKPQLLTTRDDWPTEHHHEPHGAILFCGHWAYPAGLTNAQQPNRPMVSRKPRRSCANSSTRISRQQGQIGATDVVDT